MFIITNRNLEEGETGLAQLGDRPNPKGPNELRIAEAEKKGGQWKLRILDDELDDAALDEIGVVREFDASGNPIRVYASRYAAWKILKRVNPKRAGVKGRKGKNLLFFVHGYNNNLKDVLDRARGFEEHFGVEVVAFSWPANGGGVRGVVSYLSDKRDARASVGALDRTLKKMYDLLLEFNDAYMKKVIRAAAAKFGGDLESRDTAITREAERGCPFKITMVLHSMGNYLYKQMLKSTASEGNRLLFDNVILAAADTNNEGHAEWVDRIRCRNRVYITINERDHALRASRLKAGEEQRARLGHYPYTLYSTQSVYVDFTNAAYVGDSHAYFENGPLRNERVKRFFDKAINGECAERDLRYKAATHMYRFPK